MGEHWYGRDGSSQYDADLRSARKSGFVPSVTTVMNVVAKPALTDWLVKQGVMAALTTSRMLIHTDESPVVIDGIPMRSETDDEFIKRILADSKQQAIDAANEGTRIHDACERSINNLFVSNEYIPHASGALNELRRIFPDIHDWVSEKSFAHSLGFGGKVDLHSPSTGIVVDFKTKDGDFSDGKKLAWDQNIQLAAYQVGLLLFDPSHSDIRFESKHYPVHCANIFVSRTHPGKVASHVWSAEDIAHGWSVFEATLELWKRLKKYDASF